MIFALRQPAVLLGLVLGFVAGCALVAALQRALADGGTGRGLRSRRRLGLAGGGARRGRRSAGRGAGRALDPYGTVCAVVAGVGWGPPAPPRRGARGAGVGPVLAALVGHGVLAAAGLAAYLAVDGPRALLSEGAVSVTDVVHGSPLLSGLRVAAQILLGFGMVNLGCGLLRLVPIPLLEMGTLLWSRLPRSPGARRLAYHLLEEAWGVAALLVLLLIPLAGQQPVLLALLSAVADPLLRLAF